MKKSILKNSLIVILLLSNALFIWKWWNAPEHRHRGPRNEIIERLHLDEEQVRRYDQLIKEHRSAIEKAERKLIGQKQQLFADLDQPFSDSVLRGILQTEAEIQHIHFDHFKEIERLCRPEQKTYFRELNKEIARLFSPGKKPRP